MREDVELYESMKRVFKNNNAVMTGKVLEVDQEKCTCTIDVGGQKFLNVALRSIVSDDMGFVLFPEEGSKILIVRFDNSNRLFMLNAEKLEKIHVKIADTKLVLKGNEIIINNGNLGGLVVIGDLVEKLNNIENDLNAIKNVFSTWVPVPNDGGAALKTAATSWAGDVLAITQTENIENDKVKHG